MKLIKRAVVVILVLAVCIGIGGRLFLVKYGPVIEQEVMDALKEQLTTPLFLGSAPELTLYDDLPFISARLNDVVLMDNSHLDTLLHAKLCFIRLNVWEVINGNFTISGIRVENGGLKIKQNETGQWNYKVWKEPEQPSDSKGFRLEDLEMTNIYLNFINKKTDLIIKALVEKGSLDAAFAVGEQTLVTNLKGHLDQLTTGRDLELVNLPFGLAGVLNLNNTAGSYSIEMGNAVLAGNEMVWNAQFDRGDEGTEMDISIMASALRLETLINRIWPQIPANLKALKLSGKADLQLAIKGRFTKDSGPSTTLKFNLTDGSMLLNGVELTEIDVDGMANTADLKKVSNSTYNVDHFEVHTQTGKSTGSFILRDLEDPHIQLSVQGQTGLSELLTLARINSDATGSAGFNLSFNSSLGHRFAFDKKAMKDAELTGELQLKNATFSLQKEVPTFRNINGQLTLTSSKAVFKEFSGKLGSARFQASVTFKNPKQLLTNEKSPVDFSGSATIDRLDLETLVADWSSISSLERESSNSRLLRGEVDVSIDQLIFRKFTAEEIDTRLNIRNEGVTAHNIRMETMGGRVTGDVAYTKTLTGHQLGIDAILEQLNISRMFGEWDDFGQSFLKSKHLEGQANATILTNVHMDGELNIIPEKIAANTKLTIFNGKLKEFEPLTALSKYIDLEELQEVNFDTLTNEVSMANGVISIPNMKIKSSALELNLSGGHGLDNVVDYHADLLLSDLLRRKAKKRSKEIEGHEIIEPSGKTRLFLWIRGPLNGLKIGFDNKEVGKKLKNDMKQEGKILKQLFAEEFGGKEAIKQSNNETNTGFRLEDDGLENTNKNSESEEDIIKTEKKKKKGGLFGWLKDEE
ncbi:MAG: hypothetical protein ACI9FU_002010, partial [Granulosicoccus sp.]